MYLDNSISSTTSGVPTNEETTTLILTCENGGLLIDNNCICLNHFSGVRCEIAPIFSEQDLNGDSGT